MADNPEADQPTQLTLLATEQEKLVNDARKSGRIAEIIAAAEHAADAIEYRVPNTQTEISGDEREALKSVKRFLYNAAADCWPGWSLDSARGSDAELGAALLLARRSASLVDRLGLGPMQEGTAKWLVGAFELALGRIDNALELFAQAEGLYERAGAPGLMLLARGYGAITREASRRLPEQGPGSLAEVLTALASSNLEHGKFFSEQLVMAHRVFA
ncbi:MAG TPA: hypothetical protein VFW28_17785 [Micropepsaceae bacterium]|nr:hypothetical protein [Micropepsaceae bacterium]